MADSQADPPQRTPTQEFQRILDELEKIREDCKTPRLQWRLSGAITDLRTLVMPAFADLDHNRMPANTMPLDMMHFQCKLNKAKTSLHAAWKLMDDALIDTIHAAAGADADTVARADLARRRTYFNSSNSSGNSGAGDKDTVTFGAQLDRPAGLGVTVTQAGTQMYPQPNNSGDIRARMQLQPSNSGDNSDASGADTVTFGEQPDRPAGFGVSVTQAGTQTQPSNSGDSQERIPSDIREHMQTACTRAANDLHPHSIVIIQ